MAFFVHLPQLSVLLTLLEMTALLHEFTIVGILLCKYEGQVPNPIGICILYTETVLCCLCMSATKFYLLYYAKEFAAQSEGLKQ